MVSEHSHPLDGAIPDSTSNSESMDEMTALLMKWRAEDKKEYEIQRKEKSRMDEIFTRVQIRLQQLKSSLRELRGNMELEDETDSDLLPENVEPIPEGFELVKGRILQIEATEPFAPIETSRKSGNPLRTSVEQLIEDNDDEDSKLIKNMGMTTRSLSVNPCKMKKMYADTKQATQRRFLQACQIYGMFCGAMLRTRTSEISNYKRPIVDTGGDGDDSSMYLSLLFGNEKEVSENVGWNKEDRSVQAEKLQIAELRLGERVKVSVIYHNGQDKGKHGGIELGLVVFKEVLKMLGFLLLIWEGLSVPVSVVKYQVTGKFQEEEIMTEVVSLGCKDFHFVNMMISYVTCEFERKNGKRHNKGQEELSVLLYLKLFRPIMFQCSIRQGHQSSRA
ncbi:hypothetical protein F2Q70_00005767 [Brassica cretica]|uniref:Uncharacterized protein n=1 Tax=Brassica cretica TaxID=69181 RepID=A0A8S9J119_BRACR|nr:hypothetical protein F2Q70_00005767 [Brassica cretica]